ncbi:MAG: hypothetical protein JJE39_01525 [Vicinamibacteria bacterium]|nr:hypothetical protein [Vicinamibacteria bacterium]
MYSLLPLPRVRDRRLVVYSRVDSPFGGRLAQAQGLFSEFHAVLGALKFAEAQEASEVLVRFNNAYYLDAARGPNWWAYFFSKLMPLKEGRDPVEEVHCRGWHCYGPHFFNESWTALAVPTNSVRQPYPLGAAESLRECRRLTRRHIRVQPWMVDQVDEHLREYTTGADFVLGVHFRGTDKSTHFPTQRPSFEGYGRQIERLLQHHAPHRPKIFVATDQAEFLEWATRRYGSRICSLANSPMADASTRSRGGVHHDPRFSPFEKGRTAVLTCLLLSRCAHLLKNRSSLSDCALEFNESLPWTMLLGDEVAYCDVAGIGR